MINYKEIIKKIEPELQKVITFLEKELARIRTSRASPALVEDIIVECFGQKFPLKQLAAITLSESRQLIINPWDRSYIEYIVKALTNSGPGFSAAVDKEIIRISLPPLSDEYRKNLLRLLSEKQEEARKTIRHWREKCWDEIQEKFKEKEISEDDKFRAKDELQEMVEDFHKKIEEIGEKKKKEILE